MLGSHAGYGVHHASPPNGFFQANGKLKAHVLRVSVSAALLRVKRINKKRVSICETEPGAPSSLPGPRTVPSAQTL